MSHNIVRRRSEETEESRNLRLEAMRENENRRRNEETEEQHQARLNYQRLYNHVYNYQKPFSCEVCGKILNGKIAMNNHKIRCV